MDRSAFAVTVAGLALLSATGGYGLAVWARRPAPAPSPEPPAARAAEPPLAGRSPPSSAVQPSGAAGHLVHLGEGYVLQQLPDQRLALLLFEPPIESVRPTLDLRLVRVYELRQDLHRHLTEPERRSPHGYYLDDVGLELADRLARDLAELAALGAKRTVAADDLARLDALATRILAAGDARSLLNALGLDSYAVRRAAALALGEAGFVAAGPVLGEVLEESGPRSERARAIASRFAGRPIATRAELEAWWNALPAAERFVQRERP